MGLHRSKEADAVRAFALLGICLVNMPFLGLTSADILLPPQSTSEQFSVFFMAAFAQMKFFSLFSFLFGWGMGITMLRSTSAPEQQASRRFHYRLWALGFMGVAHGLFVFTGDILLVYAILGAFLWRRRNASVAQLMASAKRWLVFAIPIMLVMTLLIQAVLNDPPDDFWDDRLGGTYMQVLSYRWDNWFYTFLAALIFQGPLVFVAFMIGLAAAKSTFFENKGVGLALLRRCLPYLALIALPINLLHGLLISGLWVPNQALQVAIGTATAIGAPALSALYLYGVVQLVQRFALPEWVYRAGRNTLSCYVLQGVLGGFCFAAYGLGLFGQLGHAQLFLASLLIALSSMFLVSIWAKYWGRGPLEPLLRWGA